METYVKILCLALTLYFYFPKTGKRCLVLLDTSGSDEAIKNLKDVEFVYKIEQNLDAHMFQQNALAGTWDYVVITDIAETPETTAANIAKESFIQNTEVIPFSQSGLQPLMVNTWSWLKGYYVKYVSGQTLPAAKEDTTGFTELKPKICGEKAMSTLSSTINIVNILKKKDNSELGVYTGRAMSNWFPIVGARIPLSGTPLHQAWDTFAVVQYPRSGFCTMCFSEDMKNHVEYKRRGLANSQTYLTVQIK